MASAPVGSRPWILSFSSFESLSLRLMRLIKYDNPFKFYKSSGIHVPACDRLLFVRSSLRRAIRSLTSKAFPVMTS